MLVQMMLSSIAHASINHDQVIKNLKKLALDKMDKQNKNFEIKFVKNWSEEEIVKLYKAGGWWKESYDSSRIGSLIKGSFAFAVVIDSNTGKSVGMGRILSDGISDAYIQDLIILPDYRGQGIGKQLLKALSEKCLSNNIKWLGLISEPNQNGFYSNLGFRKMENYTPMKYQTEE